MNQEFIIDFGTISDTLSPYLDTNSVGPVAVTVNGKVNAIFDTSSHVVTIVSSTLTFNGSAVHLTNNLNSIFWDTWSPGNWALNSWADITVGGTPNINGSIIVDFALPTSSQDPEVTPESVFLEVWGGPDGSLTYDAFATVSADVTFTPVCFYSGALVATPAGPIAIEMLRPGDLVLTADGRAQPVEWLGRQTISTRFADPTRVLPIRVKAGALGENLPVRDLLLSPDHALLLGGVLIQAGALVNGTTIVRETDVPETFVYYHVELADHALILAEGVPAETFVDNVDRMAFDNWAEHEALYPQGKSIPELPYPRAKSARQVPGAVRRVLEARAALRASGLAEAA